MAERIETEADKKVRACLDEKRSFALIAGAGSGKTSSLIDALARIRETEGTRLRREGQRVACITYTKRAVEVVRARLGFDELYFVSTLHSFLWGQLAGFQEDIRRVLMEDRLPALIAQAEQRRAKAGGHTKEGQKQQARIDRFQAELDTLALVPSFTYEDSEFSNYAKGELGHSDIIEIGSYLLRTNKVFQRITALRFPYIFVDEAQDTFKGIVEGLNLVCAGQGLPLVGYFGDPWQQIYEDRAGDFAPPPGGEIITKTENFRCSESVIAFLNAFRQDVEQYPAGDNKGRHGRVAVRLVRVEKPEGKRNTYTEDQVGRALERMDNALGAWSWKDRDDVMKLLLARQMIARRLGFSALNDLFNDDRMASSRATDAFENGSHFLLAPFLSTICPLLRAREDGELHRVNEVLRRESPAFAIDGENAGKSLRQMLEASKAAIDDLHKRWITQPVGEILRHGAETRLIRVSDRLREHLAREPRTEDYDETLHAQDKGDWLADAFFSMKPDAIAPYAKYVLENSAFSTQHGVKGEEYGRVLVLYDDIEAKWNVYNFNKMLTPDTCGVPTDGQLEKSRKLAYVSFSRAEDELGIILFTPNPEGAKTEMMNRFAMKSEQITIDG
ncbi:MAG TPA: UvrD-helicase domain-containing protein [Phenylobacterium sp.]